MTKTYHKNSRIVGIAPSSRGFGFAVLEGDNRLIDWGVKSIKGDKNTGSINKVRELIAYYQPDVVVLEDTTANSSRRSVRIKALGKKIITLAERNNTLVRLVSRDRIKRTICLDGAGTKYKVAQTIAGRFPEELGDRLPPVRKPWMSEDYRMDIFDAVALALVQQLGR